MGRPSLALWLLERFDRYGTHEALIGDLVEEIGHGRSRCWAWLQLLALCGLTAVAWVRTGTQTAPMIALALGGFFIGGVWIASPAEVFQTWAVVYFVTGTLSLFGDLVSSRTLKSTAGVLPLNSDAQDSRVDEGQIRPH
jgi:hypothetical protein